MIASPNERDLSLPPGALPRLTPALSVAAKLLLMGDGSVPEA